MLKPGSRLACLAAVAQLERGQSPVPMRRRMPGLVPRGHLVPHHSAHQGSRRQSAIARSRARGTGGHGGLGLSGGRPQTAGIRAPAERDAHTESNILRTSIHRGSSRPPNCKAEARATAAAIWLGWNTIDYYLSFVPTDQFGHVPPVKPTSEYCHRRPTRSGSR